MVLELGEPSNRRENRTHCSPVAGEVAIGYNENEAGAPVIGDNIAYPINLSQNQGPQTISIPLELYESLGYPLPYLYGEKGWSHKMRLDTNKVRKSLSLQMYVRYN